VASSHPGPAPLEDDGIAIRVSQLSKCYQIYDTPRDRLKQFVAPRLQRLVGRQPRHYFREFWALKAVSFDIAKGETVGIIGRNGSGKSTLLQLICGTLTPTAGTVETRGRVAALLELGSGFNPEFTGRENVYMNAAVLGLSEAETDRRFDDIAAFADIGPFIEQPIMTYSSGMMVRLAFAVAINVDPEILIVDEALSVGDELFQRKCFSRIESIRASGATILFVSHSGGAIVELCDRAILMDAGEKLASGSPKLMVGKYQKLIYAPADKHDAIRNEIRAAEVDGPGGGQAQSESMVAPIETQRTREHAASECFDPNLKPLSTMEYESNGAFIESPQILTLSGEKVNCLSRGESYRYTYRVRFMNGAPNVRFGMLIKTVSGLELGGAASVPSTGQGIPYVSAGTALNIEYRFTCNLNPGTYFLNAGVSGTVDEVETYLHRVLDSCMFKVMPVADDTATGIIDFGCVAEITNMSSTLQEMKSA
jgi:lipopolysaccharide transport system ATP-binding protein